MFGVVAVFIVPDVLSTKSCFLNRLLFGALNSLVRSRMTRHSVESPAQRRKHLERHVARRAAARAATLAERSATSTPLLQLQAWQSTQPAARPLFVLPNTIAAAAAMSITASTRAHSAATVDATHAAWLPVSAAPRNQLRPPIRVPMLPLSLTHNLDEVRTFTHSSQHTPAMWQFGRSSVAVFIDRCSRTHCPLLLALACHSPFQQPVKSTSNIVASTRVSRSTAARQQVTHSHTL